MKRVRSRSASIQGSGAPSGGSDPPGSSLTVDDIGTIEVLLAESGIATPTDAALFALDLTMADTNAAPTDAQTVDVAVTGADTANVPTETTTFALDVATADTQATPTDVALFDLDTSTADTNAAPTEAFVVDLMPPGEAPTVPAAGHTVTVTYNAVGAGTWVCPAGVTTATAEAWAGGGGGSNGTTVLSGNGGGGGAYSRSVLAVSPGVSYSLTVGFGAASAGNGADSWFNSTSVLLAKAGQSGGSGGAGGLASAGIGQVKFSGGDGGVATTGTYGGAGGGGAGSAGNGGDAGAPNSSNTGTVGAGGTPDGGSGRGGAGPLGGGTGVTGNAPGGGGGGGGSSVTAPGPGGGGGPGRVQITYTVPDRSTHPVYDGFERADSSTSPGTADSGQAWTVLAGTWGIVGGQAYPAVQSADLHAGMVIDSGISDGVVMFKQVNSTQESGIIFRATDNNNYWIFTVGSGIGAGAFFKRVGGTFTNMSGASGSAANGDVYTVQMAGSVLTAFRNGTQIATVTDAFNSTATKHGLRGYANTSPRIDSFDVYAL